MSVAILHSLLSFTHLLSKSISALTLCNYTFQQFKSQQAPCPCATCPVHTTHCTALDYCPTLPNCITSLITLSVCHMSCTHNTHCTRLLSNTSQLHYIAHYTVRPVCCLRHVFLHMVANRNKQLLLSSNRNIKITTNALY
jgi:hypothetical protein